MLTFMCASALCLAQVQVPPIQNPPPQNTPGQTQTNQDPARAMIPPGQLPQAGQLPSGQPGQWPQGQYGSIQVPVDGTYQVLAYEKFGQILPGMNTLKVVIRNNILIFPGDGKFPGKMIHLAFGHNNTIMLTPLDSSKPNPWQNPPGTQTTGANGTINQDPARAMIPPGQLPPAGIIQPTPQSERGVYVLSTEFFSISVIGATNGGDPIPNTGPMTLQGDKTLPSQLNGTLNPPAPGTNQPANPGFRNPNLPLPGQGQPPSTPTQPPTGTSGSGNQAVLVLRRVAN